MAIELTFPDWAHTEADTWSRDGEIITETSRMDQVRTALKHYRTLLLQHWHYRRGSAPTLVVVQDFDEFLSYLKANASAGDAVDVYDITEVLNDKQRVTTGKCPDKNGEVPRGGAY